MFFLLRKNAYKVLQGWNLQNDANKDFLGPEKTAPTIFFIFGRCLVLVEGYLST